MRKTDLAISKVQPRVLHFSMRWLMLWMIPVGALLGFYVYFRNTRDADLAAYERLNAVAKMQFHASNASDANSSDRPKLWLWDYVKGDSILSRVTELELRTEITDHPDLEGIEFEQLRNLESIKIPGSTHAGTFLKRIRHPKRIKSLLIETRQSDQLESKHLARFGNVECLGLYGLGVGDDLIPYLSGLNRLEFVVLGDTSLSSDVIDALSKSPQLKTVSLKGCDRIFDVDDARAVVSRIVSEVEGFLLVVNESDRRFLMTLASSLQKEANVSMNELAIGVLDPFVDPRIQVIHIDRNLLSASESSRLDATPVIWQIVSGDSAHFYDEPTWDYANAQWTIDWFGGFLSISDQQSDMTPKESESK